MIISNVIQFTGNLHMNGRMTNHRADHMTDPKIDKPQTPQDQQAQQSQPSPNMPDELATASFANRLEYNVEEISLEEFLAVIHQASAEEENANYMTSIKQKVTQSSRAA